MLYDSDLAQQIKPTASTYQILEKIGQGQYASVYRAIRQDEYGNFRQIVALKVLKNRNSVSQLRREFEALTVVNSVHCARVFGWENLSEGPALVLEWIDGISLYELIRSTSYSPNEIDIMANEILAQVQEGLRALDSSGLHHGDLSPSNILIDRTGCVRLIDFATSPFEVGFFQATPAYSAPELWRGLPSNLASDLFSLGLIINDFKSNFMNCPKTPTEAKNRAEFLAQQVESKERFTGPSSLLKKDSENRRMVPVVSKVESKAVLASNVLRHLEKQEALIQKTAVIPVTQKDSESSQLSSASGSVWKTKWKLSVALASFFITTVSVKAQAPLVLAQMSTSSLKLSSHTWMKIEFNGKLVGYAPIHLRKLQPGLHRLKWTSPSGRGEIRIQLKPNENLTLSEKALNKLLPPR